MRNTLGTAGTLGWVAMMAVTGWAAVEPSLALDGMPDAAGQPVAVPTLPTDRADGAPASLPVLTLAVGQVQTVAANGLLRVAIGNPETADIAVLSDREVLVEGRKAGVTNLIVWDAAGQRRWDVTIKDEEGGVGTFGEQLVRLLRSEGFDGVVVKREAGETFVSGRVTDQAAWDRLTTLLEAFPRVVNLVQAPTVLTDDEALTQPLVELEVRVVELDKDFTRRMGVDWLSDDKFTVTETPFTAPDATESLSHRLGDIFRIGSFVRTKFDATLNLAMDEGKARLLAAPNLSTMSGKQAKSFMGGEVPILTASSTGDTGAVSQKVEFKEVGVTLKMTPQISRNGELITTKLEAEVSTVDTSTAIVVSGVSVPGFRKRKVETEIVSQPGETIVIAGLIQNNESQSVDKVPGMYSVPVLGQLFKSEAFVLDQTELVITVTPRLPAAGKYTAAKQRAMREALGHMGASAEALVQQHPQPSGDPVIDYARLVQEQIAGMLQQPSLALAPAATGAVRLQLHLLPNGALTHVGVAQSSGHPALDQAAVTAVQNRAPYPPFPAQLARDELWVELPIIFSP